MLIFFSHQALLRAWPLCLPFCPFRVLSLHRVRWGFGSLVNILAVIWTHSGVQENITEARCVRFKSHAICRQVAGVSGSWARLLNPTPQLITLLEVLLETSFFLWMLLNVYPCFPGAPPHIWCWLPIIRVILFHPRGTKVDSDPQEGLRPCRYAPSSQTDVAPATPVSLSEHFFMFIFFALSCITKCPFSLCILWCAGPKKQAVGLEWEQVLPSSIHTNCLLV